MDPFDAFDLPRHPHAGAVLFTDEHGILALLDEGCPTRPPVRLLACDVAADTAPRMHRPGAFGSKTSAA